MQNFAHIENVFIGLKLQFESEMHIVLCFFFNLPLEYIIYILLNEV